MTTPTRFELHRDVDETGVSGTGVVAWGTRYPNGKCSLAWNTAVSSVAVYDSIEDVEAIHGHNGATRVVWVDPGAPVHLIELPHLRGALVGLVAEALERISAGAGIHADIIVDYAFMPARPAVTRGDTP